MLLVKIIQIHVYQLPIKSTIKNATKRDNCFSSVHTVSIFKSSSPYNKDRNQHKTLIIENKLI